MMCRRKCIQEIYSGEIRRKIRTQSSPDKKKQAKSVVRYREVRREPTPEKKKQVKSVVGYREAGRDSALERKKQAKSVVRYRITGREPDFLKDLLQWSPELPAHIRKPVKTETQK